MIQKSWVKSSLLGNNKGQQCSFSALIMKICKCVALFDSVYSYWDYLCSDVPRHISLVCVCVCIPWKARTGQVGSRSHSRVGLEVLGYKWEATLSLFPPHVLCPALLMLPFLHLSCSSSPLQFGVLLSLSLSGILKHKDGPNLWWFPHKNLRL